METAIGIVTLLVGWLLGQASGFFERRAQEKRVLKKVLSELLSIRHRIQWALYWRRTLPENFRLPPGEYDELVKALPEEMLWDDKISQRYGAAIEALSEYAPWLAFELRAKDSIGVLAKGGHMPFGKTEQSVSFAIKALKMAEDAVVSDLDEHLVILAALVSRKHRILVEKYVSSSKEPDPSAVAFMKSVVSELYMNARAKSSAAGG